MNTEIHKQTQAVRNNIGLWLAPNRSFVRFSGKDASTWLHSQTTNDVDSLNSGQGHAGALLDRQGRLQGHFSLHRWEDEYWMLMEGNERARILEQLDSHLFIEEVQIADASEEVDQVVVQGPKTLGFLASLLDTRERIASELLPHELHGCHPIELLGYETLVFYESPCGEDGYIFVVERGQGKGLLQTLRERGEANGAIVISDEAQEVLRIEAGIPRFGLDMDESRHIPETTLERDAVSYEKGCYLGQEVVARLKAYGSVKHALMGLEFDTQTDELPERNTPIYVEGTKIGQLQSHCYSPTLGRTIALAYLDRKRRVPDSRLTFNFNGESESREARVVVLPFYTTPSRTDRARALYEEALILFEKDIDDEDQSAIPKLKEAILLDPIFEDAYEALGVILHRHQRVDEAIHYMKILERLNPDCLMAHTNLSVFYVAKGLIEEAEVEKAKAAVLGIQHASDERKAKELAEAERERLTQEAQDRIGMFQEVLDIDPDDPVATFGLGKAYIMLHQYEDAIAHLEKAVEVQPDYSAAYLELGKCHEFLGHAQAIDIYREGIAVANRKGDLMPMREMERRIKGLEVESPSSTSG